MAYGDFDLATVQEKFGLTLREDEDLFPSAPEVSPTPLLRQHLDEWAAVALAVNTERSRAEMIIGPILMDVVRLTGKRVSLFTGATFDVDRSQGLNGVCDYLMANPVSHLLITHPVVAVVEAKKEDITAGLGQCFAELVAARLFNSRKEGNATDRMYGAVTTGNVWKFVRLEGSTANVDLSEYYLYQLEKILGIFTHSILGVRS
jgi:hypothetical protein